MAFFAPKFLFPALIAASVFPALVAYSGPVFSTISLWIVAIVLIAGVVVTLAHGPLLGSAHRYPAISTLVEDQFGRFAAALAGAASLSGLLLAVGMLVSAGATFLVVALDADTAWRFWLVLVAFLLLLWFLLRPSVFRKTIPWITALVLLVSGAVLVYGYAQYFRNGAQPSLLQLLQGGANNADLLVEDYFRLGLKATATAALVLVPVSPSVTMFRNEQAEVTVSGRQFTVLGGLAAVVFALTVYLSFVVAGFHWNRVDTVLEGPGNLVKLLELLLGNRYWLSLPVVAVLVVGFLVAAYIYLSSAIVLLHELGVHDLVPHQVSRHWQQRGRSAVVLVFLAVTLVVALLVPTSFDRSVLFWVFFVALAGFLGQLARWRLWRRRFQAGDSYTERHKAARYRLIALISLIISAVVLTVASIAFTYPWGIVAVVVWLALSLILLLINQYYRTIQQKVSANVCFSADLTHTRAVVVVTDFDMLSIPAIRYAWALQPSQVEVLVIRDTHHTEDQLRAAWAELQIPVPLTVIASHSQDFLTPVKDFVRSLIRQDAGAVVALYLPWRASSWRLGEYLHNAIPRALTKSMRDLERVTVTPVWVKL